MFSRLGSEGIGAPHVPNLRSAVEAVRAEIDTVEVCGVRELFHGGIGAELLAVGLQSARSVAYARVIGCVAVESLMLADAAVEDVLATVLVLVSEMWTSDRRDAERFRNDHCILWCASPWPISVPPCATSTWSRHGHRCARGRLLD